jgi:ribosomal protein L9
MQFYNFTIYAKPLPTEFVGVRPEAELGALLGEKTVYLRLKDLLVYDQYGQEMSPELLKESGYSYQVVEYNLNTPGAFPAAVTNGAVNPITKGVDSLSANGGKGSGIYQSLFDIKTGNTPGTASFTVKLSNSSAGVGNTTALSARITITAVDWNGLATGGYQVEPMGTLSNFDENEHKFVVTGNSGGTRIIIPEEDYTIVATSGYAQKFLNEARTAIEPDRVNLGESTSSKEGLGYPINSNNCRKVTFTYQIVMNDGNGTMITTDVVITDEMRRASMVEESVTATDKTINKGTNAKTIWEQIRDKKIIEAKDQYGVSYTDFKNDVVRIIVNSANGVKVDKNGTELAKIIEGSGTITVQVFINELSSLTLTLQIGETTTGGGEVPSGRAISLPASFWSV